MIRVIIVEDEGVAARKLQMMLKEEGLEVVKSLKSNRAFSEFLANNAEPNLYFLDIHLNDGIVFETLQLHELTAPIIFTTAYDEYAIRAFKQNSVDYLLKPIDKTELKKAILKFKKIYKASPKIDYAAISQMLNTPQIEYRQRIKVRVGDHLRSIKIQEVKLVYSESKITFIQTESGRAYPIEQSLEKVAAELNPSHFHRVNRSQVVNIEFIKDVVTYSNSRLKVVLEGADQNEIVVSRERVKAFKKWLG